MLVLTSVIPVCTKDYVEWFTATVRKFHNTAFLYRSVLTPKQRLLDTGPATGRKSRTEIVVPEGLDIPHGED